MTNSKILSERECPICGQTYMPARVTTLACSKECSDKVRYENYKEDYICDCCGSTFMANKYNNGRTPNKYCSIKCFRKVYWEVHRNSHRVIDGEVCKLCSTCKEWHTLENFGKDSTKWDGLANRCKPCVSAYLKEYSKVYIVVNKEAIASRRKQYKEDNKEKLKESNHKYYEDNWDKIKEYRDEYRQSVHGKMQRKKDAANRRLLSKQAGKLTPKIIKEIYNNNIDLFGELTCIYCKNNCEEDWHLEHKTPLCRNGLNIKENLAISCPKCNLRKGRKSYEEFMNLIEDEI